MIGVWEEVAKRIVEGVGVRAGELVQVRDRAGRYDVLQEILAVELSEATLEVVGKMVVDERELVV